MRIFQTVKFQVFLFREWKICAECFKIFNDHSQFKLKMYVKISYAETSWNQKKLETKYRTKPGWKYIQKLILTNKYERQWKIKENINICYCYHLLAKN